MSRKDPKSPCMPEHARVLRFRGWLGDIASGMEHLGRALRHRIQNLETKSRGMDMLRRGLCMICAVALLLGACAGAELLLRKRKASLRAVAKGGGME